MKNANTWIQEKLLGSDTDDGILAATAVNLTGPPMGRKEGAGGTRIGGTRIGVKKVDA